jgi:hypothetical protein
MFPQDVRDRVRSYIQHQGAKSPEAIADLVATGQAKLLDVFGGVDDKRANVHPPGEGEWSLRDLMLHVITAQNATAALVARLSAGTPIASGSPDRVLGMSREDTGVPFEALVEELRGVNQKMLDAIAAIPESPDLSLTPNHPFFGPLNVREWAAFQRVHDEDHIQHAQKILAATANA